MVQGNLNVEIIEFNPYLDLSFHSIIDDILGARDVKLTPEEIVVLSLRNPCVSLYSYSHQLIREMIPRGETCQLNFYYRLYFDKSSNILITDYNSHSDSTARIVF